MGFDLLSSVVFKYLFFAIPYRCMCIQLSHNHSPVFSKVLKEPLVCCEGRDANRSLNTGQTEETSLSYWNLPSAWGGYDPRALRRAEQELHPTLMSTHAATTECFQVTSGVMGDTV